MLVLFVLLSFENDKLKRDLADRERQLSELLIGRKQ